MEHDLALRSLLVKCSTDIGIILSDEQVHLFMVYLQHLQTWNRSFNLTSITSDKEIVIKHFVDSFAALNAVEIPSAAHLLDVGTGAGFPGVPLKIVRPDLNITLVEPAQKKTSFLRFIVGLLRLEHVKISESKIEKFACSHDCLGAYDYITTRALKPTLVMEIGAELLRVRGAAIFYSSSRFPLNGFLNPWRLVHDYGFNLPGGYGKRHILVCSPSAQQ